MRNSISSLVGAHTLKVELVGPYVTPKSLPSYVSVSSKYFVSNKPALETLPSTTLPDSTNVTSTEYDFLKSGTNALSKVINVS